VINTGAPPSKNVSIVQPHKSHDRMNIIPTTFCIFSFSPSGIGTGCRTLRFSLLR
jgi:hypothetical protein